MAHSGKLALTPDVEKTITETYAETGSLWLAAEAAGVSRRTVYNWIRAAESAGYDSPQAHFSRALRMARAKRLRELLKKADTFTDKDFRAVQFQIERLEKSIEKHGDVGNEAWANLTDDEVVAEVAKDPRVQAAVDKERACKPALVAELEQPTQTKARRKRGT